MSTHPSFAMIGPGVAADKETAIALLWKALDGLRSMTLVFLAHTAYAWGARYVEHQSRVSSARRRTHLHRLLLQLQRIELFHCRDILEPPKRVKAPPFILHFPRHHRRSIARTGLARDKRHGNPEGRMKITLSLLTTLLLAPLATLHADPAARFYPGSFGARS